MQPRVFSLDEVNAILPAIGRLLGRAREINEAITNLRSHLKELVNIWGQDIFDAGNPDYAYYSQRVAHREVLAKQFQAILSQINETGAVVKDLDRGLVDFYFRHNGQLIFLCWKHGEKKVTHWHALNTGVTGRKPISELKQATLNDGPLPLEKKTQA